MMTRYLSLALQMPGCLLIVFASTIRAEPASTPQVLGSCISENGPVDLNRVLFLENRSMSIDNSNEQTQATLRGQIIRFRVNDGEDTVYVQDIGTSIGVGGEDADVILKFAILDNRQFLYWRETYQHRIYRQGLFNIIGHQLTPLCQGHGGVDMSH
jgi:hypothetical protein